MIRTSPSSTRAIVAGAICLAILAGMLVGHAWPLWTGRTVVLPVRPVDPRDLLRGEFVRLDTPLATLSIARSGGSSAEREGVLPVVGEWPFESAAGRLVYVQLAPRDATPANAAPEYRAVSISAGLVPEAMNLRGRVQWSSGIERTPSGDIERMRIVYGLDAFYMQEGTPRGVENALRSGRPVQMEVAVASSGKARIRNLIVEGRPLQR